MARVVVDIHKWCLDCAVYFVGLSCQGLGTCEGQVGLVSRSH